MRRLILAVVAVASLTAASPAAAATTIGVIPTNPASVSKGEIVAFSPAPLYAVPYQGVITSWTVGGAMAREDASTPEVALKIFETGSSPGNGAFAASVVATTRTFLLDKEPQTRLTRIPVAGGERIGLLYPKPGPLFPAGAEALACQAEGVGELHAAYVEGQNLTCESGLGVAVSAQLEPDGDGDGFGDETQDRCPGVAGPATGCHSRYRGGGAGLPVRLRFSTRLQQTQAGERTRLVIEDNEYGVRVRCPDGFKAGYLVFGGVRKGAVIPVDGNGDFDYARGLARGDGWLGGRTRVKGHVQGARARGTVSGRVNIQGHGRCKFVPYAWTIRS